MGGTSIGENTLEWASESTEPLSQEVGGGLFVQQVVLGANS